MAFIAHTAPDDNIPSKNQDIFWCNANNSCVGEYIKSPRKNPPQVLKHIGHDKIPDINRPIKLSGICILSPQLLKKFLSP